MQEFYVINDRQLDSVFHIYPNENNPEENNMLKPFIYPWKSLTDSTYVDEETTQPLMMKFLNDILGLEGSEYKMVDVRDPKFRFSIHNEDSNRVMKV